MSRSLPLLTGLALVLAAGYLHGVWTQRWRRAPELEQAVRRLRDLPGDLGPWKAQPAPVDEQDLAQAGAAGWWSRRYTHEKTGESVSVIMLCGRGGPLCVHRPEHCYRGAGYEMASAPLLHRPRLGPGAAPAEFWTTRFVKQDVTGGEQLRIFWAWRGGGGWTAPNNPRWDLAHLPVLHKLYVVREVTTARPQRVEDDPAAHFLELLLPALDRAIARP